MRRSPGNAQRQSVSSDRRGQGGQRNEGGQGNERSRSSQGNERNQRSQGNERGQGGQGGQRSWSNRGSQGGRSGNMRVAASSPRASRQQRPVHVRQPQYTAGPYGLQPQRRQTRLPRAIAVIAAIAVVALVVFLVANAAGSCSSSVEHGAGSAASSSAGSATGSASGAGAGRPAVFATSKEESVDYQLDSKDVLSVADSDNVEAVNLDVTAASFSIDPDRLAAINADVAAIEGSAPCGFLFADIGTGRAIAYHAGKVLYVASASKAPLVFYALTHPAQGDTLSEYEREDAEGAIAWSDNDMYFELCRTYFTDDYLAWLSSYGIAHDTTEDDWFPTMCARSLGAVWADVHEFLDSGSEDAEWLKGVFDETEESYIRDGLEGLGATVYEKAGWIYDEDVSSVTDAGIVEVGGRTYLMVIETEQSELDDSSRANVAHLARDLYDARGVLAPHITIGV